MGLAPESRFPIRMAARVDRPPCSSIEDKSVQDKRAFRPAHVSERRQVMIWSWRDLHRRIFYCRLNGPAERLPLDAERHGIRSVRGITIDAVPDVELDAVDTGHQVLADFHHDEAVKILVALVEVPRLQRNRVTVDSHGSHAIVAN